LGQFKTTHMQSPGAWLDPRNSLPRSSDKHILWGKEKDIQELFSDSNAAGVCLFSNSDSSLSSSHSVSSSTASQDHAELQERYLLNSVVASSGSTGRPLGPKRSEVANPGAELQSASDVPRSNRNKIIATSSKPIPSQSISLPKNSCTSSSSSNAVSQAAPVLGLGTKRTGLRALMAESMLEVHEEISEPENDDGPGQHDDMVAETGNAASSSSFNPSSGGGMSDLVTVPERYRDSHRHQMTDGELFKLYSLAELSEGSQDEEEEFIPLSVGSVGHPTRRCRPCHYYRTKAGCVNGYECGFCHCKHSKRSRPRLGRADREKCRQLAQWVFDAQKRSEWHKQFSEAQLLLFTGSNYKLAAYATTVLRSLIGGAVLRETHHLSI